MKIIWVATLHAGKAIADFTKSKSWRPVLLSGMAWLCLCCSGNDDTDALATETPVENESVIIYTDIEPDFISDDNTGSFNLDLNKDQNVDFTILFETEWNGLLITGPTGGGVLSVSPWYNIAVALDEGTKIPDLYPNGEYFTNASFMAFGDCNDCDYWKEQGDKFLGVKILKNGKSHYGWVLMNISSPTQWTVKGFAYNSTPDKTILAGQKE